MQVVEGVHEAPPLSRPQLARAQLAGSARSGYRPDIDGLRAVAVLAVVGFHAFPAFLPGGFVGVDVFFVISGFLITGILLASLRRGEFSFLDFYAHRVRRIVPALVVVLLACLAVGRIVLLPDEFMLLRKHVTAGAAFVQNFNLWTEAGYFDVTSRAKPLLHLWSLALEEQYYLVAPLLLWAGWALRVPLLGAVACLGAASLSLCVWVTQADPAQAFYLPLTRFWEILAGAALACVQAGGGGSRVSQRLNEVLQRYRWTTSVVGAVLLVFSVLVAEERPSFPGWQAAIPVLGAVLLMAAGPQGAVNRTILANRVLVVVGLVSYPLYLWHWPLLSFADIMESGEPAAWIRATAVGVSFVLAWLTYVFVERPVRFGSKSAWRTALPCVALVLIAFAGPPWQQSMSNKGSAGPQAGGTTDPYCRTHFSHKGDLCLNAAAAAPTTLVVGDSHALKIYQALAERQHKKQLAGNTMLVGQTACPFPAPSATKCGRHLSDALALVQATPSVDTVVLASVSVRHYIESKRFEDHAISYEDWGVLLDGTVERLGQLRRKVVVVIDNPMLDFDPRRCDVRPVRLTEDHRRRDCTIAAPAHFNREQRYREVVFGVARAHPEITVVDASSVLCDAARCAVARDGHLLYQDDNHLSMLGAGHVADLLLAAIERRKPGDP